VASCKKAGLGHRVASFAASGKAYSGGVRRGDPAAGDVERFLPESYRAFVGEVGHVGFDLGERHRLALLPTPAMLQVTGAMGDPARPFEETRGLREKKRYTWPFAFFAGWDLADVNGWCFMRSEAPKKVGAGEAIKVWNVEDSVPESPVSDFSAWLTKELAAAGKSIDSVAKVKKLLKALEELEDDRKVIRLHDFA
jgi:hypothetical protein